MRSPHNKSMLTVRASGLLQRIILNGFLPIFLFFSSVTSGMTAEVYNTHAYSWYPVDTSLEKISPLYRISLQQLSTPSSISLAASNTLVVAKTMPIGHRAFLNLDLDFLQIAKSAQLVTDANGKPLVVMTAAGLSLPDHGIWLDNGITAVANRVGEFFKQYRALGGVVDFVSLDYRALALTANDIKAAGEASGDLATYLLAIQNDKRFAPIQSQLGFADLRSMYAGDAQAIQRQQTWNAVMKARMAGYLNQAFYSPLRTYFGSAQVVARDQAYYSSSIPIPGENYKAGAAFGTGQSKTLTGQMPASGLNINQTIYAANSFNAFRYEVNRLRSTSLTSERPLYPYLTGKSQTALADGYAALLAESDLYQEMLLHAGLTGARKFVYVNGDNSAGDDVLVNKVFREFDVQTGETTLTRLADNGVDWTQPFVLSPASNSAGKVWRFTPELAAETNISTLVESTYPAKFSLSNGLKITVPGARVQNVADPVSAQGLWLKQEAGAEILACPQPVAGQSCVAYYQGTDTTVQPALMLEQPAVLDDTGSATTLFAKNWSTGGADAGVGGDNFTSQYNAAFNMLGGVYRFTLKADDSVRLWVDGALVLNGQSAAAVSTRTLTADVTLTAGLHRVRLQYSDISSNAAVDLSVKRLACGLSNGKMCLTFVDKAGKTLIADTTPTQTSNGIQFDFSKFTFPQSVDLSGSVLMRWDGMFSVPTDGDYAFELRHGLGALKIWIDGTPLYESSGYSAANVSQALRKLTAGTHRIQVELKAVQGSYLNVSWLAALANCNVVPTDGFCGEFFSDMALTGTAKRFQSTERINFDWGSAAPVTGGDIPVDKFSARWVGDFTFKAGNYTFTTTTDDGVKVWLDDRLVIDSWRDQWNGVNTQGVRVGEGVHRVKMEYYENGGSAVAKLNWQKDTDSCVNIPDNKFCTEYFANYSLSGNAAKVLETTSVNFNLNGQKAPFPEIASGPFSSRWLGNVDFVAGNYNFTVKTNEGVRLWLDDKLVIDSWAKGGDFLQVIPVTEGKHKVQFEYHSYYGYSGGYASAKLDWTLGKSCGAVPNEQFCAEYYPNNALQGLPVKAVNEAKIDSVWKDASPSIDLIPADNFSMRWQGNFDFSADKYRFIAKADDGLRLWVDGNLIIDQWTANISREYIYDLTMTKGSHLIKYEYHENYGWANATLNWEKMSECSDVPVNKFCGSYFNDDTFVNQPLRTQTASAINFDWAANRPLQGINSDGFAVRWEGKFDFNEGYHRFSGEADDGIRVWVGDVKVIDHWEMDWQWQGKVQAVPYISKGQHTVKVEYRERYGSAKINLAWDEVAGCATTPENTFCMELFNNKTLSGIARQVITTDGINFDWAEGQPDPLVSKDGFSARWKGKQRFTAGNYRFTTDTDEGVRVLVDGVPVIDKWTQQNSKQYKILNLTEGFHTITMESFDSWSVARAKLNWDKLPQCSQIPDDRLCAEFYATPDLTGDVVDIVIVDAINFDWAANSPSAFVPKDKFSVRWSGKVNFDADMYRFVTDTDDGVKVFVGGEPLIDAWSLPSPWYGKQRRLKKMTKGLHNIKVEYREDWGSAKASVIWEKAPDCAVSTPEGKFCASFYNTMDLSGEIADTRYDNAINFDWASSAPHPSVKSDGFSVRWNGKFDFAEGEYTFTARSDDGFRLVIDGQEIIKAWKDQGPTTYSKRLFLTGGLHTIKVEYYEKWGGAVAQLGWKAETLSEPQSPVNLRTTALAQDKVSLAWDAQPIVSKYKIHKNGVLLAIVSATALTDAAVKATSAYKYTVSAIWPNGKESRPATLNVVIPDTQAPTAPTNLAVQSLTPVAVTLTWANATDNIGVKSYQVFRDGKLTGETSTAGFVDNTLQSAGKYAYSVKAIDAAGNVSPASTVLSVTTKDGTAPTIPTGLAAEVIAPTQIALEWQASSDNVGIASYRILRNSSQIGTSKQPIFTDNTAKQDTFYRYQIVAVDAAGNISAASTSVEVTSGDATAPNAPPNVTAETTNAQHVKLAWGASIDNKGVSKYRITRDGRLLGMTDLLSYTDTTVKSGQTYSYNVKAMDAAGNISLSSEVVSITVDGICESTQLFYKQNVEGSISKCITCHVAGGDAQNTQFILSKAEDASSRNLGTIKSISQLLLKTTLLNKVSGKVTHGGGAVFPVDSKEYGAFSSLLDQLSATGQCTTVVDPDEPVLLASMAANCASCHGTNGISVGPATPSIGGMSKQYFGKVLLDYQSGHRASTVMGRIAKGYSADELNRLSEFFSQQPYAAAKQEADATLAARGRGLHQQYCASCHISEGKDADLTGVRLAGQWKPYMQRTLKDYATKHSQTNAGMSQAMNSLYAAEGSDGIAALAEFYASNAQDITPPEQPTELDAVSYTPTSVTLTWMDAEDNWGILYYDIYRDGVWIGRTRFNTFTDLGLKAGNYQYTVVAVDVFGNRSVVSESVASAITSDEVAPEGVQLLNYQDTLRKASLLLLNRLPTQPELDTAKTEEDFRVTLRKMMDGKGALDPFVYRAGHETFLSNGAAWIGSNLGLSNSDFPTIDTLSDAERNAANDAIRKEPVFLLQYLVGNDKPWTEVLTANYTIMNPQLAKAVGAKPLSGSFTNAADAKELRPVRIPQVSARYPGKAFAHAGVLSSNAWLSRFPTTDTNRNRHRAAKVYKQFMALDIEALAQRPLDDSKNGNYLVPTMQNPNCMVCHTIMEPVAGAFRDWGNNSRFLQNFDGAKGSKDSLSGVYKSGSYPLDNNGQPWYHTGDTWYRDMFPAGLNNRNAPGGYGSYTGITWASSANLVKSPSAESGISGWTVNKGALEAGNKTSCSRIPRTPKTGTYLYQLGSCNTQLNETLVWQDIALTSSAAAIDQGKAEIDFGAYFSALSGQDTPSVWVEFLDTTGKSLGKTAVLSDKTSWTWVYKNTTAKVPKLTRKLRFVMQGLRATQSWADKYVDAYVDDVFLIFRVPDTNVLNIPGTQDSLQWLGNQLVKDPRFAKGGVYFWYKSLFKRDPLKAPVDPNAADYATQMAAFNAQDELLTQLASRFAYDQGRGAWNVKDLMIDLVASPLFRAKAGQLSESQQQVLNDTGLARLLTPEELNAKVKSLTGTDWYSFRPENAWSASMGLFYGGFDGGRLQNKPNTDMNSLMGKIPERMAVELSCNAVADDFRLATGSRKLFPYVEATDTPVYEEIDTSVLNLLVNPGAETGLDGWTVEQGTARVLSGAAGCDGGPSIKSGKAIFNPGSICKNPTPLGLLYQTVDTTAWADEIDTGESKALFGAALRGWSVNNDEASVYLSFRDASDNELGVSQVMSSTEGYWKTEMAYALIPTNTRSIRFYMKGKRVDTSTNPNNDSFVDDVFLRVVTNNGGYMPAGEKRIRANLQHLYRQFLNEKLAVDDPEITRSFNLFSEVWASRGDSGDAACRLYSSWEDPTYTKRAWGVVMMYLMNDARFLYE